MCCLRTISSNETKFVNKSLFPMSGGHVYEATLQRLAPKVDASQFLFIDREYIIPFVSYERFECFPLFHVYVLHSDAQTFDISLFKFTDD